MPVAIILIGGSYLNRCKVQLKMAIHERLTRGASWGCTRRTQSFGRQHCILRIRLDVAVFVRGSRGPCLRLLAQAVVLARAGELMEYVDGREAAVVEDGAIRTGTRQQADATQMHSLAGHVQRRTARLKVRQLREQE